MSWLGELFSVGAGALVDSIGKVIDNVSTNDEERGKLKIEMAKEVNNFQIKMMEHADSYETELTNRLKADMSSDSWLAKNVRPMTLIGLTLFTMGMAWATTFNQIPKEFQPVLEMWVNLFTALDLTAFGFYFGARGLEKIVSKVAEKFGTAKK